MTRRHAAALFVAASFAAAACFSEHATGLPDVVCSTDLPGPAPGTVVVAIRDFAFHPAEVMIEPGNTVLWVNCEEPGTEAHTTTSDDGIWDSGWMPDPGDTFSWSFDQPGTFGYHCVPHRALGMIGTVLVE